MISFLALGICLRILVIVFEIRGCIIRLNLRAHQVTICMQNYSKADLNKILLVPAVEVLQKRLNGYSLNCRLVHRVTAIHRT